MPYVGTSSGIVKPSSQGYLGIDTDCGPWISATASSRVRDYRYDYKNHALQVRWTNRGTDEGYIYREVDYEGFRSFVRAVSKGRRINAVLNDYAYERMTPDEITAASTHTGAPGSRRR
jgi:hypothetical protein